MIKNLIAVLLLIASYSCKDKVEIKPMKYDKNGINYNCDSYFTKGVLQKVECFNKDRDTLLIEFYKDGLMHGLSTEFFPAGGVKRQGNYRYGVQDGIWKEYFKTGVLSQTRIYKSESDSLLIVYEKNYTTEGKLNTLIYQIDRNFDKDLYAINDTVNMDIILRYSENPQVSIGVLCNNEATSTVDTLFSNDNKLNYSFIVKERGNFEVNCYLYEYDENDEEIGSRPFRDTIHILLSQ